MITLAVLLTFSLLISARKRFLLWYSSSCKGSCQ